MRYAAAMAPHPLTLGLRLTTPRPRRSALPGLATGPLPVTTAPHKGRQEFALS
ncbi:hypothetical protein HNQ51_002025 [Inhella inkyongensis]|uniref:Uncharacterized protein n=1 Tax=Inhella inkyongensis TaxID=392593 RepID=A0A840S834_9BURK|nr:hypothetical protein [Inhella inkyongensis]